MENTLLNRTYIFEKLDVDSFEQLIHIMSKPLIKDNRVLEDFPLKVIQREAIFPTGLPTEPYGVAIPHTDPEFVKLNTISIATLKNPLSMTIMGSVNEKVAVSMVFLLSLGESNKQLNVLKQLMKAFQNEKTLMDMMDGNAEKIYELAKVKMEL